MVCDLNEAVQNICKKMGLQGPVPEYRTETLTP